jgi:HEAT repeat protein
MRYSKLMPAMVLGLTLASVACATGKSVATVEAATNDVQVQSASTTVQSFNAVEGADLMAKLDSARERARAKQSPYWSAYAFDVRSGVAVDAAIREFHGSINTIGDTSVLVGTTADGLTVETRNLAIFLLRDPASNQITRMEIYNLERKREYSGYPVYWLGRANNEESLNYLRALTAAAPLDSLSERAVLGIALHDDQRVGAMLKSFVSTSPNQKIRSTSVYWLGQVGGETAFLAGIVKNESEDRKLRRTAAYSIGQGHDRGAMATIQSLYETVKIVEIRQGLINAASDSDDKQAAFGFLLNIAKNDVDWESRRNAVRNLGHFQREDAVDELMKIFTSDTNLDIKRAALRALAETKSPRAQTRLLEIAKNDNNPELRKQAIRVMSERGESAVDDLIKIFDAEQSQDVRRSALQTLSEIKSQRVEDKLFAVAGSNDNLEVRKAAIRLLGERAGRKSFEFLSATAQSADGNAEVQVQAVRSIGERHSEEAVPLLIKIAKTHPNQLVRKQAIRSLGESGDPRAVDFFREVLTKEE